MSIITIGGNLFSRHPINFNRVHKYSKDLISVIITLGTTVIGARTVFNGLTNNNIGIRAHDIKHSNGMCVVRFYDKIFTKALFGLDIEMLYPLSYAYKYFFTLYTI